MYTCIFIYFGARYELKYIPKKPPFKQITEKNTTLAVECWLAYASRVCVWNCPECLFADTTFTAKLFLDHPTPTQAFVGTAAYMNNPLNEVNSFSSTDHAISVTEVGNNAHSQHRVSQADSGRKTFCTRTSHTQKLLAQALGVSRAEARGCELGRVNNAKVGFLHLQQAPTRARLAVKSQLRRDCASSFLVSFLPSRAVLHLYLFTVLHPARCGGCR